MALVKGILRSNQLSSVEQIAEAHYRDSSEANSNESDEFDQVAQSIEFAKFEQLQEHQAMAALFPTFSNLFQRAKRLLATDSRDIWQRFIDACEADDKRYMDECKAKGLDFLI